MAGWPNGAKINSLTFDVSSYDTLFWFRYLIIVFCCYVRDCASFCLSFISLHKEIKLWRW